MGTPRTDITTVDIDEVALSPRAWLFEGRERGSSVTFFDTRHPPGDGPGAHRHPYDETFYVMEGEATFTIDGEQLVAREGLVVVVPAGAIHSYVNSGSGVLRNFAIQPAPEMAVEWIDDPE